MGTGAQSKAHAVSADGGRQTALVVGGGMGEADKALRFLDHAGFEVEIASDGPAAQALVAHKSFDMALLDQTQGAIDGLQLLTHIKNRAPQTEVILITAAPDVSEAVEAIRRGAVDYMTKPVDTELLAARIECLTAARHMASGPQPDGGQDNDPNPDFLTCNPEMQQLLVAAGRVAGTRATVLITGESGTGKEVLAAHIHRAAGNRERPFVAVNCAALPETLIESELFGHEKGAFTGASQRKTGKFEQVGEGTIVLDEIGDMPIGLQPKILRILQERRIERLGGSGSRSFKGQVIAITNQDLEAAVKAGQFREDLFYRINVVPFHLPPLRARLDDIPLLTRHFVAKYADAVRQGIQGG
jgi:DNA-binding NtrC family response regulator